MVRPWLRSYKRLLFHGVCCEPADPGMIRLRAASATLPAGRPLLMLTTPRRAHQAIGSVPSLERFWDPESEEASWTNNIRFLHS
jgi:hypothetical protein